MTLIEEIKLIDYVLGLSDKDERATIEAQMQTSNALQERIAILRDTLALPALVAGSIEPAGNLGERILQSIGHAKPFNGFIDRLSIFLDLPEAAVTQLLQSIETAQTSWEKSELPGVRIKKFSAGPRHEDCECALLWMPSNSVFPSHGHHGDEWGFVLQGEAEENNGQISKPGDIVYHSDTDTHTFTVISEEPFVFFVIHQGITIA